MAAGKGVRTTGLGKAMSSCSSSIDWGLYAAHLPWSGASKGLTGSLVAWQLRELLAVARSKLGRPEEQSSEAQGGRGRGGRGWLEEGFVCRLCVVDSAQLCVLIFMVCSVNLSCWR